MKGFFTSIEAVVQGNAVKEAEMKFTPAGEAVASLRVGCGGSEKRAATFIDIQAWGDAGEVLNKVARKGMAIRAVGVVSQRKWQYNEKWYERLELIYITELSYQDGTKMIDIAIPKKGDGARPNDVPGELEPEDIPFVEK